MFGLSSQNQREMLAYEAMSSDELRLKLFERLKSAGVADKLKSQLRAKIVAELKLRVHAFARADDDEPSNDGPLYSKKGRLLYQVLDSMVIEYLKERGFEFTLSVFLPECGLNQRGQILSKEDVLQALHLNKESAFFRQLNSLISRDETEALLVNLVTSLIRTADIPIVEKETQTNLEIEDFIELRLNDADRRVDQRKEDRSRLHALTLEERMLKYQQTIEDRLRAEMEQQLTQFRSLELSQMRLDEKQRHQSEIKQVRLELERQHHEIKAQAEAALEKERQRLSEREKELESANMQLRQNILEENNKALIKEVLSRTDAELSAKEIKMERDSLQRKYEEVVTQLSQFQNLKERYAEKLQESMAQYKINVNKEYSSLVSSVEIDRAKIEAEQVLLQERARQIDKIVTEVHRDKEMVSSMQQEVKEAREQALAYRREKEAAEYEKKELKLQVMSHKTSSALEFEIQSLKQQLVETERMSEKRQEEYQSLLKTLIGPNDEMQKELNKVRRSESKWQRECQHLVKKLDTEMNRSEDLQRRLDEAVLQCKQLKRENSELKLSLHDTREAFGQSQQAKHHEDHSRDSRKRYNQSYLLDPLDPSLDITYGRSHVEQPRTRIPILPEVHSIFSRPLDLDFSESIPPSAFVPQDDHQTFTSQSPKRYDTILPTENQTSIDRPTSNKTPTPRDGANHQLINATHTAKYDLDGKVADNETKSKTVSVYAKAEKTHSQKPIEIIGNVPTSSASPQALAKSTREQQEEERRAQDERAEIERQKAQRRQRDEERLKNERAEMERVRKEREELDRAEKKAKESASTDQRDNKVVAIEEKQSADQAREAQKAADKEKQKLDETNHAVQELENDPAMQKYIEMAKERREKLGMSTGSQKPDQRHPDDYQVEELMKKLDNSELMSSRDSDSRLFGAGATADEISAPISDDTSESDRW